MNNIIFDIQRFAEVIHGDTGGNSLHADEDKTQVYGLAGDDTLSANGKSDVLLIGGSGNDVLNMTGGNGTLSGGAGSDTFNLTYSATNTLSVVIEDINPSADKIVVNFEGGTPQLNYSISGNDVIWTDAAGYFSLTLKGSTDSSDYFNGTAHEYIWEVLEEVNEEREDVGLKPLILSQDLTDGAGIRSQEIITNFSHTRPDGSDCWTVLTKERSWSVGGGYYYQNAGENIAAGNDEPDDTVEQWMNSPGHRANILDSTYGYTMLGVGHSYDSSSEYGNYWVQMFSGGLKYPDTLSTAELLTAEINGVSSTTATTPAAVTTTPPSYIYAGGNQIISDYQSGEKIYLGTMPTGFIFGSGNFVLGSTTGNLLITNANDKIIDFADGAGNDFAKAYKLTNAGVIDGRGFGGYQYLVGSDAAGTDIIFAGNGGSQLWGGNGVDSDVLVGGYGADMFIGGKYQGSDTFMNAATADTVFLNDATFSDLIFAGETDSGTVALAFNTGNVIAIQSSEAVSANIVLADGKSFRFNHVTKTWQ